MKWKWGRNCYLIAAEGCLNYGEFRADVGFSETMPEMGHTQTRLGFETPLSADGESMPAISPDSEGVPCAPTIPHNGPFALVNQRLELHKLRGA